MFLESIERLPKDPHGFGNLFLPESESMISVQDFVDKFGGEDESFSYAYLANHEATTPMWKEQFQAWNEDGILPD